MTNNILIVNSDIEEATSIKNRIASSSTNAICAHTIGDALSSLMKMEFCLVILDAAMSASDDHNLLKAMRNSHTMPILVLSSHADSAEKIHAFNAGANAYMGKPYSDEECLAQALLRSHPPPMLRLQFQMVAQVIRVVTVLELNYS